MMGPELKAYLELICLGFVTGAYGALIGAGGGFVLMPVLLILYPGQSPELLTSISLAVVFFNTLSGSEAYAFMGRVDFRSGALFAAATIPGAVIGALATAYVPRRAFDLVLGALLILGSIFLLAQPKMIRLRESAAPKRWWVTHRLKEVFGGASYEYSFNPVVGVALSLFVGFLSSFLGIGGGIIHVPALVYLLNFPVHVATATSHFILMVMALTGTVVHFVTGTFAHAGIHRTLALAVGVLIGAPLGAHLSGRLRGSWIIRGLALALRVVGLRIILLGLGVGLTRVVPA